MENVSRSPKLFMTAEWLRLINITYAVDPALLLPHLPAGLELDCIGGRAFIGLVPFSFEKVRVRGFAIPLHTCFPEMNLRFYVKHASGRGVVFIRECVPKAAVAWLAKKKYNEPYIKTPMKEITAMTTSGLLVRHELMRHGQRYTVEAETEGAAFLPAESSYDHYFKELMLGFGKGHDGKTKRYRVEHPAWDVFRLRRLSISLDFGEVFGKKWAFLGKETPINSVLVKGSAVRIFDIENLDE